MGPPSYGSFAEHNDGRVGPSGPGLKRPRPRANVEDTAGRERRRPALMVTLTMVTGALLAIRHRDGVASAFRGGDSRLYAMSRHHHERHADATVAGVDDDDRGSRNATRDWGSWRDNDDADGDSGESNTTRGWGSWRDNDDRGGRNATRDWGSWRDNDDADGDGGESNTTRNWGSWRDNDDNDDDDDEDDDEDDNDWGDVQDDGGRNPRGWRDQDDGSDDGDGRSGRDQDDRGDDSDDDGRDDTAHKRGRRGRDNDNDDDDNDDNDDVGSGGTFYYIAGSAGHDADMRASDETGRRLGRLNDTARAIAQCTVHGESIYFTDEVSRRSLV